MSNRYRNRVNKAEKVIQNDKNKNDIPIIVRSIVSSSGQIVRRDTIEKGKIVNQEIPTSEYADNVNPRRYDDES